jgi:hypothetical protein
MFRVGLVTLVISVAAFAQQGTPGEVVTNAPQQVVPSVRPLVQPPTVTLSNGFSPAVVTMPQTMVAEQPTMMVTGGMPQGEGVAEAATINDTAPADFNYAAVSAGSAFDTLPAGPSLADIAKQSKNYKVQAHKTYTNEDIDRLNAQPSNNGIMGATLGNGQPIVARNNSGFDPASGIANMPEANGVESETQLANNPTDQNPMNEGQMNATSSNVDQGRPNAERPTMPLTQPGTQGSEQQMPTSDNPH